MATKPKTGLPKFDQYTEGVASGRIDVCLWVKLAVDRHYKDMKRWPVKGSTPKERHESAKKQGHPYYFEPEAVLHYVNFFADHLRHYEGAVDGQPIIFEPWQWFCYGSVFGWLKTERFHNMAIRRFRFADVFVPKKNGKSIISGGTALYMMDADEWPGAQCYILAKNQSHAKELGYRAAVNMVEKSPELSQKYRIKNGAAYMGVYYAENNNAFYKPITSKPESEDGRNVHFCGPDETKDWIEREIYEVMVNGTVNAANSLIMSTSTAGTNPDSLGDEQMEYIRKILDGSITDEATFGIIYGVDPQDKVDADGNIIPDWWLDKRLWKKANPNYGVSVYEEALESIALKAKESPSKRNAFQTKHLNVQHTSTQDFVPSHKWQACMSFKILPVMKDLEERMKPFAGRTGYGGLDMGQVSDFAAFVLSLVPEDDEKVWNILPCFWIPEETIRERRNRALILPWIEEGYITTTQGDVTDADFVEDAIMTISTMINIEEIAFDRYKLDQMVTHLMDDGLNMVPFGQGYVSMNPAVDNLETMILQKQINHGDNPVLSWMIGNVVIRTDPAGNRKFDKKLSKDKIDGVVALAMGLSRGTINQESSGSVYDERGVIVI